METIITQNKMNLLVSNIDSVQEEYHQKAELLLLLEGNLRVEIQDKQYNMLSDDVLIINRGVRLNIAAGNPVLCARLLLSNDLIDQIYNGVNTIFVCDSTRKSHDDYQQVRILLKQMLLDQLLIQKDDVKKEYSIIRYLSCYYQLMELLIEKFLVTVSGKENTKVISVENRMEEIALYIRDNHTRSVTLQDLAKHCHVTEAYLSRYFKEKFNMTFTDYLKKIRMSSALEDLAYSDKTITAVSHDNGFSSVAFFNRFFKETYQKTPSEYRRESQLHHQPETGEAQLLINGRIERFLQEEEKKKIIQGETSRQKGTYSVKTAEPLRSNWDQIMNIGSAADLLRTDIQEHVLILQEALKFRYIRFWNLFSESLLIDIHNKDGKYNFTKLDQVFDFIIRMGLKPYIDLQEKEDQIIKGLDAKINFKKQAVIFENLDEWKQLLRAFIRHYSDLYGHDELAAWKIEIWLGGYPLKGVEEKQGYYQMFDAAYEIVKETVPELEVGGPGFLWAEEYRIIDFWNGWITNAIQPDFVSTLNYGYEVDAAGNKGYVSKTVNSELLLHDVLMKRRTMEKVGLKTNKFYISEYNLTISDRNYINDSCFRGAILIKCIIDIYGKADIAGYFNASDRISEYYDSNMLLHGGKGIISKDGILKPAALAIEFLNRLYPYYIGRGNHYLVTTNNRNCYGIVCHNAINLNHIYYDMDESQLDKSEMRQYFRGNDELELELNLTEVVNGNYRIRIYRVNEKNGSILDEWKDMGFQEDLSRADIKYLRKICEPRLVMHTCLVEKNIINLKICMDANEFCYIRIEKTYE